MALHVYHKNQVPFAVLTFVQFNFICFFFTTVYIYLLSIYFIAANMPPKKEEQKKRIRKRKFKENVTDQPPSGVITTMPTERAGTSGGYLDNTNPQQAERRSSSHSDAPAVPASTVVCLPSMHQTNLTAGLTHSPPVPSRSILPVLSSMSTGIVFQ